MAPLKVPEHIGSYEILRRLAVGGMAEVFLGRTGGVGGFEKLVAIKRVLPHLAHDEAFVQMFLDEARIAAKLGHSNIVQIFDLGHAGDSYYIAMEYVPGPTLLALLDHFRAQQGRASGPLTAFIVLSICAALEHAHTKRDLDGAPLNIVHRDVSPSNVMVSFEGDVKLIDFGIVKARQRLQNSFVGQVKGKNGYIAPEALLGEADFRADIYAAGVVLHRLLTNHPYREEGPLPPPSELVAEVPTDLEAICLKAVATDPELRFRSAAQMGAALEKHWHKTPFTRLQLAAWMKGTFTAEYQEQMRLVGMPPPELGISGCEFSPPAMVPNRPRSLARDPAPEPAPEGEDGTTSGGKRAEAATQILDCVEGATLTRSWTRSDLPTTIHPGAEARGAPGEGRRSLRIWWIVACLMLGLGVALLVGFWRLPAKPIQQRLPEASDLGVPGPDAAIRSVSPTPDLMVVVDRGASDLAALAPDGARPATGTHNDRRGSVRRKRRPKTRRPRIPRPPPPRLAPSVKPAPPVKPALKKPGGTTPLPYNSL